MARYLFGGGPADVVVQTPTSASDTALRFAPFATVQVYDSLEAGSLITDLQLTFGGATVSTLTCDARGRIPRFLGPDGYTLLYVDSGDSARYALQSTDLATIVNLKLDRDELPEDLADLGAKIVGFERRVAKMPSTVEYDTTTNTWPLVELPVNPVIWKSKGTGAAPPAQARWGFDYWEGFITGPTTVPNPTPEPDPEEPEPDPQGITLYAPVISGAGANYSVTAKVEAGDDQRTFRYLQIAVRGPGGQNADTGHAPNFVLADGTSTTLSGTFTATQNGVWRAYSSYNLTGGTAQTDWVDGPATTVNVSLPTPTPGGNDFPLIGRSGLQWNSGGFVHDQWEQSAVNAFGTYRGTPSDTMLVFNDRSSWGALHAWYDGWTGWPGIFILSTPPQPQGMNNSSTAAGQNNQRWRDYGSLITSKGYNNSRFVLRLGWECNGDWYDWSWKKNNQGTAPFVAAFKNVVTSIRQTAPNITIDLCLNKDHEYPGQTWQSVVNQLLGYVDVIGFDGYDSWDGWRNDTGRMNAWYNKGGPQRNSVAAYCRANGLLMSLDEWGLCSTGSNSGTGGGDDSLYISGTWDWLVANKDVIAWESYYHEQGAPEDQHHELFNYPSAEATYRNGARWGGGL